MTVARREAVDTVGTETVRDFFLNSAGRVVDSTRVDSSNMSMLNRPGRSRGERSIRNTAILVSVDLRHRRGMKLFRSIILSGGVTLCHCQNPLSPAFSSTQTVFAIVTYTQFDDRGLMARHLDNFNVGGHCLDAVEIGDQAKRHEALGIHMLAKEKILAQVLHGEIVVPSSVSIVFIERASRLTSGEEA